MSIEIPISPDIEAALRKYATDSGLPIDTSSSLKMPIGYAQFSAV